MFEYILALIFFLQLARSYSHGFFSPYFLVSLHLYVGVFLRYFYLSYEDNAYKLVGLGSGYISTSAFYELVIYYFLFFIFFEFFNYINKYNSDKKNKLLSFFEVVPISNHSFNYLFKLSIIVFFFYIGTLMIFGGSLIQVYHAFSSRVVGAVSIPAYLTLLPDLYVVLVIFLFCVNKFSKVKNNKKITILILSALLILFISGARGNFLQFIMTLLMIHMGLKYGKVYFNKNILIFTFLVLLVLTFGLVNRMMAQQENLEFNDAMNNVSSDLVDKLTGTFAIYDHFILSREYVLDEGYSFGKIYINNLVKPIPRSIWSGKPESLDLVIRNHFWGDKLGGVPPGVFGEFYITGGIVAAFLLIPLFSLGTFKLNRLYEYITEKNELVLFVSMMTPYLFFSLIRLGFDVAFTRVTIFLFFLFLVKYISKVRFKFGAI